LHLIERRKRLIQISLNYEEDMYGPDAYNLIKGDEEYAAQQDAVMREFRSRV